MAGLSEPLLFDIRASAGVTLVPSGIRAVEGGSINRCYAVTARDGRRLFLKVNEPDCAAMFAAEFAGLQELAAAGALRVPEPIAHGAGEDGAWLLLEYLDLDGGSPAAAARLGEGLAAQHRHVAAAFGWHRDNTIGSTLQRNGWHADWAEFFVRQRLGFQLGLAERNGAPGELTERGALLLEALPHLLTGHAPQPSLLHGDLWGGNWGMIGKSTPVVFDPAVYFGDREADIAMTELFGGFPGEFHAAYRAAWPLDPGYARRRDIYNLYHVLNHLNLFGGSYLRQAIGMIERALTA